MDGSFATSLLRRSPVGPEGAILMSELEPQDGRSTRRVNWRTRLVPHKLSSDSHRVRHSFLRRLRRMGTLGVREGSRDRVARYFGPVLRLHRRPGVLSLAPQLLPRQREVDPPVGRPDPRSSQVAPAGVRRSCPSDFLRAPHEVSGAWTTDRTPSSTSPGGFPRRSPTRQGC